MIYALSSLSTNVCYNPFDASLNKMHVRPSLNLFHDQLATYDLMLDQQFEVDKEKKSMPMLHF